MRVLLFLGSVSALVCWGIPLDYPLRDANLQRWSVAHGFPEESVTGFTQSSAGYLWVATHNGLLRFDGKRPVPVLDGILLGSERHIVGVVSAGTNQVWAVTVSGSLAVARLDRFGTFLGSRFTIERSGVELPGSERVLRLDSDQMGRVMLVRSDALLIYDSRLSGETGLPAPKVLRPPLRGRIRYACLGTNGEVFALQGDTLYRIRAGQWEALPLLGLRPDVSLEKMLPDGKGGLWIASTAGLLRWENNAVFPAGGEEPTLRQHITVLLQDGQGALWTGGSAGVCRIIGSLAECRAMAEAQERDDVTALIEDGRGNIWVGRRWGGILRLSERLFEKYNEKTGMMDLQSLSITEDDRGQLWVGAIDGVYRIRKNGELSRFHRGRKLEVHSVLNLPGGDLMFATNEGLLRQPVREPEKLVVINKRRNDVTVLYRGPSGRYYLADAAKLLVADYGVQPGLQVLAEYDAPKLRAIHEDRNGTVWMLSLSRGLMRLRDGRVDFMKMTKPLAGLTWMDMTVDTSGLFLLGSSRGLWGFDPQQNRYLTATPYSDGDWVFRSLDDGRGRYWLATRNGILQVKRDGLIRYLQGQANAPQEQRYANTEGLPSLNFGLAWDLKGLLATNGRIYFPSLGGLVSFDPARLAREPRLSGKLAIRAVEVNGNSVKLAAIIGIPAGAERLEIYYEAVNMALTKNFRFSYKLEGYDQHWFEAGADTGATYTNLRAGTYRFRVRVANSSSVEEIELPIEVAALYWETWPFRIALAIGLCLLAGGVFLWRHRAILRRNTELAQRVRERTIELETAIQMAKEAANSKSDFLATMSHEIRTPLNGVIGMLSLLEATGLDAEQKAMVRTVHSSGESLMAIVNDILDFSKLEVGKIALEFIAFDLRQLVEETTALFRPVIEQKGLTLTVAIDAAVPQAVLGDPVRLRQVISNLVSNAVKFTSAGGVRVEVWWANESVRFSVSDTGPGIPKEHLPRLFEMFSQADASMTRRFGGTGLGLSICLRLVEAMAGKIEVNSIPGQGTDFILTIPLPRAVQPAAAKAAHPTDTGSIVGLRVLIAEDNATNAHITRRMLERVGCQVAHVNDGEQAVQAGISGNVDLILMDCQMPVLDGYSAARQLRSLGVVTPIIACTANALSEDRERCAEAGMNDYLTKPFRCEDLEEVLLRWVATPVSDSGTGAASGMVAKTGR